MNIHDDTSMEHELAKTIEVELFFAFFGKKKREWRVYLSTQLDRRDPKGFAQNINLKFTFLST
jgi:hypothetical protein